MDKEQHITQDAAEHYAVFVMADFCEKNGWLNDESAAPYWNSFHEYLDRHEWHFESNFAKYYPQYKINIDSQIPNFVNNLHKKFPNAKFSFEIDEANFRNQGIKADFRLLIDSPNSEYLVSLKNYIGKGGILRPQVSSGTFLSFAAGFIFDRVGVGKYTDPRPDFETFQSRDRKTRNEVLYFLEKESLVKHLDELDNLQSFVRSELLTLRFYDKEKIRKVIEHIVPVAQVSLNQIFNQLGYEIVRKKFLERVSLDSTEEILFFDDKNLVDSITNPKFHNLCKSINDPNTPFLIETIGQSLRFIFGEPESILLTADVPLTINTNGAWHRPNIKYEGLETKNDKGTIVELAWGQLRPYKSKEIATSINTYLDLKKTGILN